MTSYASAIESLYSLGHELKPGTSRKFELAHMRAFCQALGNPQKSFPSVLIAGTNGKGSTAATIASILQASGHRVGLYTSPHIVRINERICLNGRAILDEAFVDGFDRVTACAAKMVEDSELPHLPSFFETVTAIAFDFFAASQVEIAILEVGLGGRLDATNVVDPILSVITDIDLDHQYFLGDTIAEAFASTAFPKPLRHHLVRVREELVLRDLACFQFGEDGFLRLILAVHDAGFRLGGLLALLHHFGPRVVVLGAIQTIERGSPVVLVEGNLGGEYGLISQLTKTLNRVLTFWI